MIHKNFNKWYVSCYENSGLFEFLDTTEFDEAVTFIHTWLADGRHDVIAQMSLDLQL